MVSRPTWHRLEAGSAQMNTNMEMDPNGGLRPRRYVTCSIASRLAPGWPVSNRAPLPSVAPPTPPD